MDFVQSQINFGNSQFKSDNSQFDSGNSQFDDEKLRKSAHLRYETPHKVDDDKHGSQNADRHPGQVVKQGIGAELGGGKI